MELIKMQQSKFFKEFPIFGVGVKNFRHESNKEKYKNLI